MSFNDEQKEQRRKWAWLTLIKCEEEDPELVGDYARLGVALLECILDRIDEFTDDVALDAKVSLRSKEEYDKGKAIRAAADAQSDAEEEDRLNR